MKNRKNIVFALVMASVALPQISVAGEAGNNSWFTRIASFTQTYYKQLGVASAAVAASGLGYCAVKYYSNSRLLKEVKNEFSPRGSGIGSGKFSSYLKIANCENDPICPMYFDVQDKLLVQSVRPVEASAEADGGEQEKFVELIELIKRDLSSEFGLDDESDSEGRKFMKLRRKIRDEMWDLKCMIEKIDQRTHLKAFVERHRGKKYGSEYYDSFFDDFRRNITDNIALKQVKDALPLSSSSNVTMHRALCDLQWELMESYLRVRVFYGKVNRYIKDTGWEK